jgi:hypothetical protein
VSPFSPLERSIVSALDELAGRWRNDDRQPELDWTKDWKMALHSAAGGRYEVRASSYPACQPGCEEWLWDMAWLKRAPSGALSEVVLACEGEWNTNKLKIDEDFQKLLAAKASTRLMIFEKETPALLRAAMKDLRKQAVSFGLAGHGDRYVLSGFDIQSFEFAHDLVVVP